MGFGDITPIKENEADKNTEHETEARFHVRYLTLNILRPCWTFGITGAELDEAP